MRSLEYVPFFQYSAGTNLNTTAWITEHFAWRYLLTPPIVSEKPFDGLDKMLLLTWVRKQFPKLQPFRLNYYDLRLPNLIVDGDDNLVGIIDWDHVAAVPAQLTAVSIAESFFPGALSLKLDNNLNELFLEELRRLEWENSSSTEWSQMFLRSRENRFLFLIFRQGVNFLELQQYNPDLVAEALHRSSENLALAAVESGTFSAEFYLKRNRTIPDYPEYVEIQEALGIYGRSRLERWFRKVKRFAIKRWDVFIDQWATRRNI